jgi:phosphoribosyl-AMP cyclohydrolase / phosphoribosyl-ATP pyrophosphohydrolase
MHWIDTLRYNADGLLPVVAQQADTGELLMLAYANAEAIRQTLDTGRAHYWSRSRGALWCKGETSGHVQEVVEVRVDCDDDALLYRVRQHGPACHTLASSCFYRSADADGIHDAGSSAHLLERVADVVRQRHAERPADSYTTYLFAQGLDKILKKLGEETTEVVIAAKNTDCTGEESAVADLRGEVADLLFHVLVLLQDRGVPLTDVWSDMQARFGAPPRRTLTTETYRPEP